MANDTHPATPAAAPTNGNREKTFNVGAAYDFRAIKLYAQYGQIDDESYGSKLRLLLDDLDKCYFQFLFAFQSDFGLLRSTNAVGLELVDLVAISGHGLI